jgi:hypothetical protein
MLGLAAQCSMQWIDLVLISRLYVSGVVDPYAIARLS